MPEPKLITRVIDDIRHIYASNQNEADRLIEDYLNETLGQYGEDTKTAYLDKVTAELQCKKNETPENDSSYSNISESDISAKTLNLDNEVISKLFRLFLGREVYQAGLSPEELLEKLAGSLNTIFDSLNELVQGVNISILGEGDGEATIRHVIGSQMGIDDQFDSIGAYCGKIKQTFLTTQEAFKESAYQKIDQILDELDPEKIKESSGKSLKIGPLKKAENFQILEKKYNRCRKWFESENFMEDFLREFEKNFHKISKQSGR